MTDMHPLVSKLTTTAPALGAAVTGDQTIGEAPYAATVTDVTYTPEAAITGADTNTRTLTIVNKGAAGAGTTVVATLALTAGVTAAAFDEKALTVSAVAGADDLAAGDVLAFVSTHSASGLADPGGLVQVTISRA